MSVAIDLSGKRLLVVGGEISRDPEHHDREEQRYTATPEDADVMLQRGGLGFAHFFAALRPPSTSFPQAPMLPGSLRLGKTARRSGRPCRPRVSAPTRTGSAPRPNVDSPDR